METRPSSSSVAKTPALFSTSASASFHSRLTVSSSSSQRRLRALSRADSDGQSEQETVDSPVSLRSLSTGCQNASLPLYSFDRSAAPQRRPLMYWTVIAYCLLSVAFFTTRLFNIPQSFYVPISQDINLPISPINDFSHSYRLSRIMPMKPQTVSFFPFASYTNNAPRGSEVTACLWVELENLKHIESWSSSWEGPLSVVVVTKRAPQHAQAWINALKHLPDTRGKATFHVIRQMYNETRTANSYLNLARLFARTRYVAIFPASPQMRIPDGLSRKISTKVSSFNASRLAPPHVISPSKFTVNLPVPPLVPLLVEQTYPIWCSERFFTAPSREDDWKECLWQFWLNSYGSLPTLAEPSWKPLSDLKSDVDKSLIVEEIIHQRLSNRFRHESCVLAAKSLKDRSEKPDKVDPRKAQWLRKTCRQYII